jgi:hypothetical protein
MLQMTLHLTRLSRRWGLLVLGLEVFLLRSQKNASISMERHKSAIFDRLKIKMLLQQKHHLNKN